MINMHHGDIDDDDGDAIKVVDWNSEHSMTFNVFNLYMMNTINLSINRSNQSIDLSINRS